MSRKFINYTAVGLLFSILFVPSLKSIDKVAEHFLAISILNIILSLGVVFFIEKKDFTLFEIFKIKEFKIFIALIIWATGSLIYTYNIPESIIELSEISSVFITATLIYFLLKKGHYSKKELVWFPVIILFIESAFLWSDYFVLTNYNFLKDYNVSNLKGVYMNKNIASASLAIKVPFLLYVLNHTKNKILKTIIIIASLSTIILIVLGSARAFILALIVIIVLYLLFILIDYRAKKFSITAISIILSGLFLGNIFTQQNGNTVNNRLETIKDINQDESASQRLRYYFHGIDQIKSNLLIGVGLGNWKLKSIDYDSKGIINYVIPYNMHNDFLELGAELGIIGMLLYLSLFVLIAYRIWIYIFKFKDYEDRILITTIGISFVIYLIDANFNFPLTRTESQVNFIFLFVIYLLVINEKRELK